MLVFLLSLVLVTMAVLLGVATAHVISIIPISILARAEQAGRYARLGARRPVSSRTGSSGRRSPPPMRAGGYGLGLTGAEGA